MAWSKLRDRTGDRYGLLTVISRAESDGKKTRWVVKCDCGAEVIKPVTFFNSGGRQCSKSCPLGVHVKHGGTTHTTKSKEYSAWVDMKRRCLNKNSPNYSHYGGRGITICPQWVDDYAQFYADIGPAPDRPRMSIDRIDNNGNYEPSNVRWATPSEQMANRNPFKHAPGLTRAKRK